MDRKTGPPLQKRTGNHPFNIAYRINLRPTEGSMALGCLAVLRCYPAISLFTIALNPFFYSWAWTVAQSEAEI